MSSRIAAALLAAGLVWPAMPALYDVPVLGPAIAQAYYQLPKEIQGRISPNVRAQILPPALPEPNAAGPSYPGGNDHRANQAVLDQLVAEVGARHSGSVAISVAGVHGQYTAGDDRPVLAFSTMKVPLAIVALRQDAGLYPDAEAAVTRSDNEATWRMEEVVPATAVADVIAQAGSRTTNSAGWRMGTQWTTSDQAQFASGLRCVEGHEPVLDMMGRIVPEQRWGLGRIEGARFKGGWNFHEDGHVARQFGLIPGPNGDVAVAITAYSPDGYVGSYRMLDELADGLAKLTPQLPTSRC
ncbi:hypothetical protein CGLAU_03715 [Corynebacterium glaucum]|uniref:Beta-lactamase n=1 Tax=Corynebacterium glaucum TaxID=187491 RepID=A0A1Q2HVB0_9CORY|nr:hypothetical protein [Corynebacterium glaucum]AQQ14720.1 hypothetical protein CGLAU_03715 [Corynebacterium glaucum]